MFFSQNLVTFYRKTKQWHLLLVKFQTSEFFQEIYSIGHLRTTFLGKLSFSSSSQFGSNNLEFSDL